MQNHSNCLRLPAILCILTVLVSVACSAQTPLRALVSANSQIQNETDCFSLGKWDEREACFARQDDEQINLCEKSSPLACRPYKEMYFAEKKIIQTETEIQKYSVVSYKNYLIDDPDYVNDLDVFLRESGKAWASYRDSQCQLEPYINGISRREFANCVEQCRLERTLSRIVELQGLLATLKSNQE